uniref:Uncharacterized protein n=1 Tax=Fagus sylvatica TaxID=28930 RepID=A0A2N9HIP7_FAGSY
MPKTHLSLSPTDDAGTPANRAPLRWRTALTSSESSKFSGSVVRLKIAPPRRCRRDQPFTSSENPQTRRYLLSFSLTLSLTSPTHCVAADRHLQRQIRGFAIRVQDSSLG